MTTHPAGIYYLGEPTDLFYWGPSRATPQYMSDFMTAEERFFTSLAADSSLPTPPKTLVLFFDDKMVWLNDSAAFERFVEEMFRTYEEQDTVDKDIVNWKQITEKLPHLSGDLFAKSMVEAWSYTLFAELALYGAEAVLRKRLQRFDVSAWQEIWGAFTTLQNGTFLSRIDNELLTTHDPQKVAKKYPWIQDGYKGATGNAEAYFGKRLDQIKDDPNKGLTPPHSTHTVVQKFALQGDEAQALQVLNKIVTFMDDRKAWMMKTRHLITKPIGDIENGWIFDEGKITTINSKTAEELWQYYVDFKTLNAVVQGTVASNGAKHFITGEVAIAMSPTDPIAPDKILVVPATGPSYVPLMRQAKALITDHGGMLSHAAIVAREFGLPCIVGTKQATKLLKDDDTVILNLVTGEVSRATNGE